MKKCLYLSMLSVSAILTGCGSDSSNSPDTPELSTDYTAVVLQAVFGQGSNVAISDAGDLSKMVQGYYAESDTNFILRSDDEHFYIIGRDTDVIDKYEPKNPGINQYGPGYSLKDAGQSTTSRVHDMAFISEEKAYLALYGETAAWIVNTTARNSADFKTGQIDLSAYVAADDTQSPAPEMHTVALYNDKAFITMQRQGDTEQSYGYPRSAYIAVIDTTTDTEIDVNTQAEGLKGIELDIINPINSAISGNQLYVQGIDYYGGYTGGLVRINMDTYEQTIIYNATEETGSISDVAIVNNEVYVVIYHGWKNNSLAKVNTTNGSLEIVDAYKNLFLSFIKTGPQGNLWIGQGNSNEDNPSKLIKLSKTDLSIMDSVNMDLDPIGLSFVTND